MTTWEAVLFVTLAVFVLTDAVHLTYPEVANERLSSRIVSGWEARDGQFPHQISLRMVNSEGGVSSCGGTIIHAEWGLTAAHCTATRHTMVIRVGGANLTRPYEIFELTEYYMHPRYNAEQQSVVQPDDVALLKFGRTLVFNEFVQPVRLQPSSDRNRNYNGQQLVATGWGRTWTNGDSTELMRWVYLRGISNIQCFLDFSGSSIIQDSTLCAAYYNVTSQSTCQGDSGGSLAMVDIDGKYTQVGISSFVSSTGCHTELPAGFVRPGHYHDWYTEVTGINFDWNYEDLPTTVAPTTESPEDDSSSSSSESSSEEDEDTTTTTAAPEEDDDDTTTTTAAPEEDDDDATTTAAPEEEDEDTTTTTAAPEEEDDDATTTKAPEEDDDDATTTAAPATTTEAPEDDDDATTTAAPEEDDDDATTTAAPATTTAAPEDDDDATTTAAPEEDDDDTTTTTAAPEEDVDTTTTAAAEEDEETEGDDDEVEETESRFGKILRLFW